MLLALTAFSAPAAVPQPVEQELLVRISPAEHSLTGRATLTARDGQAGLPTDYALAPAAVIDAVTVEGRPVPFHFEQGRLQIGLGDEAAALSIAYRIRFEDPVPQEIVGIEDPSYGVTATITPQGTFLAAASGWHPRPVGNNSRFRVTIAGPPGLTGVTAGRLIGHTSTAAGTQTRWQTILPQPALALAAGNYQLHRQDLGETQVLAFLSAGNASLAAGYLQSSRQYLQLYQDLFGPYPYAKFAVVENFYPTGYGLPGWTLLGNRVIRLPFIRTTSLPHEIAHAWWGNAVEVDYASGNWAEGLATYVADYYLKELASPVEAREYRRKLLRDFATLAGDGDDPPLQAFRSRRSKRDQAIGYGKAAMVFHMLRQRIGDEAFWAGLQEAARQGLGQRYGWSDLLRHFEAASDRQLAEFFHQWTARSGAPQLQLTDVALKADDSGWLVAGRLQQQEPHFELRVPVRLETAGRSLEQTVHLNGRQTGFEFAVAERPLSLTADPDNHLFRMLAPEELPATISHLRASSNPLVIVAAGSESLLDASSDLLRGLQWQQAPVMSESDYLARRPPGQDLLVLGWPRSPELRPELPAGFEVSEQEFRVGGNRYMPPDDVLFMVVDNLTEDRVAGYFLPGTLAAARDTARRIPHYGRYSYLVFSDGRNQVKATWEPASSPLKLFFGKEIDP